MSIIQFFFGFKLECVRETQLDVGGKNKLHKLKNIYYINIMIAATFRQPNLVFKRLLL